jgi:hypothetical protein
VCKCGLIRIGINHFIWSVFGCMNEVKIANCLLLGIVLLMLFTYMYTLQVNLGANINLETQVIAAINA